MKINVVCLTLILLVTACQEATVPFFAEEESVKRQLENDFICDELARANSPYANSGTASGVGDRQAFNICTPAQFLNIGKRKQDWDKHFNIRADLDFKEELLVVGEDFFPLGEITFYNDFEVPGGPEDRQNNRLAFTGVIDGKGQSILRLSVFFKDYNKRSIGIFPYIAKSGEIRNLNFENIRIIHNKGDDFISDRAEGSDIYPLSVAGGIIGLSDGARFENVSASRVQLFHDFSNIASSSGVFSGLLINTIANKVSLYTNQPPTASPLSGGFAGIVLGGRFTDIKIEIPNIPASTGAGGFAGAIEGKFQENLSDVIDSPINVVAINNLNIKFSEDQQSSVFGGISANAHDLSVEGASIELKKVSELDRTSGGFFGTVKNLELHNSSILFKDEFNSKHDICVGKIGGGIGDLEESEVNNITMDLNSKSFNLNKCKMAGVFAGNVNKSSISNLTIKNGEEFIGKSYVGGAIGSMSFSTLENTNIFIKKVESTAEYSFTGITPVDPLCFDAAFLGGAVGYLGDQSTVKNVDVIAEKVNAKNGKAAVVGGLVGFNRGNIFDSVIKTKIVKGAHIVGGLVGLSMADNTFGKIKNNQIENTSYISGWALVGGLAGSSGGEYSAIEPFCGEELELVEGVNHLGGEILYNSVKLGSLFGFEDVGGAIGHGYNVKANSSYVHINGVILQWDKDYVDSEDHTPTAESTSLIDVNSFGGFVGRSIKSSVRNSYVSSRNLNTINLKGLANVGGFVGTSQESQFFYNFSNLNIYGESKGSGICMKPDELTPIPTLTSKVMCEFHCKLNNDILDIFYHKAGSCEFYSSTSESDSESRESSGSIDPADPVFDLESIIIDLDEVTSIPTTFISTDGLSNSVKTVKGEGEGDEDLCKNILNEPVALISTMEQCLSKFTCLKANGEIDQALTDQKSCESMGYCGDAEMSYASGGDSTLDGEADENGYVNERDCCINGEKSFLSNKWVRNYWTISESEHEYKNSENYWSKSENKWQQPGTDDETSQVPNVGKFAGGVDISYDEGSNSIESASVFVGNYSKGECLNPNNNTIQNEYGDKVNEYQTDDTRFYECEQDLTLKNQVACVRLGICEGDDNNQRTRGTCKLEHDGSNWTPNTWKVKVNLSPNDAFGTPDTCVSLNHRNVKEKINVKLDDVERENLDTCNDSILKQLGRQDQVLFSTKVLDPNYFNESYKPPMSFWNFNYFWKEVENDVPVLFR
tara:strand:+ start:2924 stop:6580 length:3657 start_codon:yes stop_codon:yes gene_type:complete